MEGTGELLRAGCYGQNGRPHRDDGLEGTGDIRPRPVHTQNVQQLPEAKRRKK